ncbi:hypothetical protein [Schinkia azotoformans]|uniref:Uncharacterized protein n=1 Tax=Schinkia azotoformans LMG 9581 TaxID=1131731 RepID=K6D8I7_SCHAZ|nr:hypothetical protein [Schinkia azotoformans]EKN64609.1 hypothetical protein BAZO_13399 [Schinkia azotoformans LMG 9581]MEC1694370.1 hypothetical protein [Schinkia azotoformans]MEC1717004.1 hypothetical protein [Schinkia azotoformans]MEC1721693.1 hypothetical protein [Schinkia azotoformans]MEC1747501.1 hypothetical protein [Schinkia azotoformans]
MNSALKEWGVPTDRIHFEFFGPAADIEEQTTVFFFYIYFFI